MDTQTRHALKQDKFVTATTSGLEWIGEHRSRVIAWSVGAVPEGGQLQPDSAAPAIPPGASDVLKRLMEQRQNQLKQ